MWGRCVMLAALAACGRLGFDRGGDAGAEIDGDPGIIDCATAGAFACDGFEGTSIDPFWFAEQFDGTATLDTTIAHRGLQSLHAQITTLPGTGSSAAHVLHTGMYPSHLFVRTFVYQPAPPPVDGALYINAFAASTSIAVELRNRDTQLQLDSFQPANTRTTATPSFPGDSWHCVELEFDGLPSSGTATVDLRVYLDDTERPEMHQQVSLAPMTRLGIGLFDRSLTEAWFDDVYADTQRVGCLK